MYESGGKAVAFHVLKPCIGFIQGFFFVFFKSIEDRMRIDYNYRNNQISGNRKEKCQSIKALNGRKFGKMNI